MRLAVISDIHGNLSALEAALADIERQEADQIVCLGDVASFGPQPKETLNRVRALNCPVVMGNTDAYLLEPRTLADVASPNADTPFFLEVEAWCALQLDKRDLAYIESFQPTVPLELDGLSVLCFHGSPKSYDGIIRATTPDDELGSFFDGQQARLLLGGHTHAQLLRRFRRHTFVNPGSVGLPYEFTGGEPEAINPHWAEYALLEVVDGHPSITFRRVPYNVTSLFEAVRASNMPYQELWLEGW